MTMFKDPINASETIQKQIMFLSSIHSNYYFQKHNYCFCFSPSSDNFFVSLTKEEQSSGSCWSSDLEEPSFYKIKTSKVIKSIFIVINAIVPLIRKKDCKLIASKIFESMIVSERSNHEYYGNYSVAVYYKINISKIYQILNDYYIS